MEMITDTQICDVIREKFASIDEFRVFLDYAKLSQAYAESKGRVAIKQRDIATTQTTDNSELAALQQIENDALDALNAHIEAQAQTGSNDVV